MIGVKNSHNYNTKSFALLHISKDVKAVSCIINISICAQQNNNFRFPTSTLLSFRVPQHDTQNFKNKEEWHSIEVLSDAP